MTSLLSQLTHDAHARCEYVKPLKTMLPRGYLFLLVHAKELVEALYGLHHNHVLASYILFKLIFGFAPCTIFLTNQRITELYLDSLVCRICSTWEGFVERPCHCDVCFPGF